MGRCAGRVEIDNVVDHGRYAAGVVGNLVEEQLVGTRPRNAADPRTIAIAQDNAAIDDDGLLHTAEQLLRIETDSELKSCMTS